MQSAPVPVPVTADSSLASHPLRNDIHCQLGNVPFTVAPERTSATTLWAGVRIHIEDQPTVANAGATRARRVVVCSGLIDAIWCTAAAAYLFQVAYEKEKTAKDLTKTPLVLEVSDPNVSAGFSFLLAAFDLLVKQIPVRWSSLPRLSPDQFAGARQLTLAAFGFVLYHELGHMVGNHVPIASTAAVNDLLTSREQENEADNFALDHILMAVDLSNDRGRLEVGFRSWGVVTATLAFTAKEFGNNLRIERLPGARAKPVEQRTHPLAYSRLDRVLKSTAVIEHEIVRQTMYTAACVPLYVLAVMNGFKGSFCEPRVDDLEDLYERLANELHEQLQRVSR